MKLTILSIILCFSFRLICFSIVLFLDFPFPFIHRFIATFFCSSLHTVLFVFSRSVFVFSLIYLRRRMAEFFRAATNCDPEVAKASPLPIDTFEVKRQQFIHEKLVSQAVQTQLLLKREKQKDRHHHRRCYYSVVDRRFSVSSPRVLHPNRMHRCL